MKKRTLRALLKWSFPVNIGLFVLALIDYSFWDSRGMVAILAFYAVLLICVVVVLVLDATPAFRRIPVVPDDEGPRTIVYRRI